MGIFGGKMVLKIQSAVFPPIFISLSPLYFNGLKYPVRNKIGALRSAAKIQLKIKKKRKRIIAVKKNARDKGGSAFHCGLSLNGRQAHQLMDSPFIAIQKTPLKKWKDKNRGRKK